MASAGIEDTSPALTSANSSAGQDSASLGRLERFPEVTGQKFEIGHHGPVEGLDDTPAVGVHVVHR